MDLLAAVPAEGQTFWAPDFQRGLEALIGFTAAVTDANAPTALDAFSSRAGVDLRTARGWNALGIDTDEGVALLLDALAPPTVVVRTHDLVRLDKFIILYAETRSETDGHAIGNVQGNTVHSYRGVHWSHLDGYTWFTVGRNGRVAMAHRLQHMHRENKRVAPEHPLVADANFARDMNQVRAAAWMGRGRVTPLWVVGGGAWTAALDLGPKGFACQVFVDQGLKSLPVETTPLDALMRRFDAHDVVFSAGQYMDFNFATSPPPAARLPPRTLLTPLAPQHSNGVPASDPNAIADPAQALDQFITQLTGLHWREDVVPNIRGVTLGLGVAPEAPAAAALQATLTIDVADPRKAAGWLALTAQTMGQQNIVLRPAVETVSGSAFTVYRADSGLMPWPGSKDQLWAIRTALVGKTVIVALGQQAFNEIVHVLLNPQPPPSPWFAHEAWRARGARAHGYSVIRLGRIGDAIARWVAAGLPYVGLPTNPPALEKDLFKAWSRILQRVGDVVSTATQVPGGQLLEWSSNLTTLPDAPGTADAAPALVEPPAVVLPETAHGRVWLHTTTSRAASFVELVRYSEHTYLSQTDAVHTCRRTCWSNPHCLGFYEQTKLCPEARRNDHRSDPTHTHGRGCIRVCGYFTEGQNPLYGNISGGPPGSVWLKSDLFSQPATSASTTPEKWFGRKVQETAGP